MRIFVVLLIATLFVSACNQKNEFIASFDNTNDRIWIGSDFWSIPLEDWKVQDGSIYSTGNVPDSRVVVLTHALSDEGTDFEASVKIGLTDKGSVGGAAGLIIGMHDKEDPDVRAACYFGGGIKAGASLNGFAFLGEERTELPEGFSFDEFTIHVEGNGNRLTMQITDHNGLQVNQLTTSTDNLQGLIAVASNMDLGENEKTGNSKFVFDDLKVAGSGVIHTPENAFGPILWTMHTLSNNTLKLMAFLPPVGEADNKDVSLQFKKGENWETAQTQTIEPDSRTAIFRIDNWNSDQDADYRVVYVEKGKDNSENENFYTGTIRRDPVDRSLKFGGLTCQFHFGFPYTPVVENLKIIDPDILYFSGDQIYEGNGGYGIKRYPAEEAILNYLGKYYMFGWAFGDLMRDRPTICTPDDHDVFHGNLWGEGGAAKPEGGGESDTHGFMEPVRMVNAVNRTQCGQLPDPFNPEPIDQGMTVWYTGLNYGRVSFAIVSDRIFKTGPETVSDWEGRHDHMKEPRKDLSFLDKPGVKMLGDRQMEFLDQWIDDWNDVDMKVLLSQTVFANVATHHGGLEGYLYGDLDSGGWPKSGRDKAISLMRKGAVFHINGDQHVPSLVQYGLDDYRDAGWSYCTPAIAVMYLRWFLPDELNVPVNDRPEHGYPNTGKYTDAFGNKNYVYAIGNPGKITIDRSSRYSHAQIRSSGFGMITFNKDERTINIDAWRFLADVQNPNPIRDQFPGWPFTISQFDNLGKGGENVLPEINVDKPNQVIRIINEKSGELVQVYRMKGTSVQPRLYESGSFTIRIGENENVAELKNLATKRSDNTEKVTVKL